MGKEKDDKNKIEIVSAWVQSRGRAAVRLKEKKAGNNSEMSSITSM